MKKLIFILITFIILGIGLGIVLFVINQKTEPITPTEKVIEKNNTTLIKRAWLPWWDFENAVTQFNNSNLNQPVAFIYVLGEDGSIISKIKKSDKKLEDLSESSGKQVVISIYNDFDGDRVSDILNDEDKTQRHIKDLVRLADKDYVGALELDYEYLLEKDKDAYTNFVKKLSIEIRLINKQLHLTLHPKTTNEGSWHGAAAQDWKQLSNYADFLAIMAYDYHWLTSDPGPIAPLDWVEKVSIYSVSQIPENKIILGIPAYAYDWIEGSEEAVDYTPLDLQNILKKNKNNKSENESGSIQFTFTDKRGKDHEIWTENNRTYQQKKLLAEDFKFAGYSIWRLGGVIEQDLNNL